MVQSQAENSRALIIDKHLHMHFTFNNILV